MTDNGTITVKLVIDTTEALERLDALSRRIDKLATQLENALTLAVDGNIESLHLKVVGEYTTADFIRDNTRAHGND